MQVIGGREVYTTTNSQHKPHAQLRVSDFDPAKPLARDRLGAEQAGEVELRFLWVIFSGLPRQLAPFLSPDRGPA